MRPSSNARARGIGGRALFISTVGLTALLGSAAMAADQNTPTTIQEVIVTAQKRTENVQNVPSSVSVVGKDLLNDLHVTQLTDVGAYVPGLQIASGGTPGQATIIIRGVAPLGPGATVGTYIDDTPVGGSSAYSRNTSFALDLLPYDVERIEVLRGPQGTLYGASTMGGLLKYVLIQPDTSRFSERAGADVFGIDGAGQVGGGFRAMINGPLVKDELAVIASVAYENTPGFIDSAQTGATDQNGVRQISARLSLLWRPTDNLSVSIGTLYQKIDADGVGEVALTPTNPTQQPVAGDLKDNNYFAQPFSKWISYNYATVKWDLGWANFVSATSYADSRLTQVQDVTREFGDIPELFGEPAGLSAFDIELDLKKVTQEFRLASPSSAKFEWLVGVFYTDESSANNQLLTAQQFNGAPIPGLNPLFVGSIPSTYKEYAAFGDATLHLTNRFNIGGGVRFSHNDQTFGQVESGSIFPSSNTLGKSSEDAWTYSANSSFHFTRDAMVYGRIASAYEPGGPNVNVPGVPPTFQPSTLVSYEIGVKSEFWARRALLDVSVFRVDLKDIQIAGDASGFSFFATGGTARSQGVEADTSVRLTDNFALAATAAYDDAVLTEDVPALGALSGDRLPNVPRWSGSLQASYTHPLTGDWKFQGTAGLRLVGDRVSSPNHNPLSYRLPGYSALDLSADVTNGRWTVRLFAKNVTDERGYTGYAVLADALSGAPTEILGSVLQPRTIGVAVDAAF